MMQFGQTADRRVPLPAWVFPARRYASAVSHAVVVC